ncbi:unnamed protein product [Rotaria socialis]
MTSTEWYKNYTRFLTALKNRLTKWQEISKWKPTLPPYILEKLNQLHKIRNRYYKYRQENDRTCLRQMTKHVRTEILIYRSSKWNDFLENIQQNHGRSDSTFWKHLSRIYRPKSLPFRKLRVNGIEITSQQEITKELHEYYSNLFTPPTINRDDPFDAQVEIDYSHILKQVKSYTKSIELTSPYELKRTIDNLKPKKSAGYDAISNFMIKRLPPGYLQCLSKCFNNWFAEGILIDDWKIAKIITLNKVKTGSPQCDQTRPISLLATHSKLYEKILLNRIQNWAETNHIIPVEQSGFRKGCLLQTRVLSIYQEVKNFLAANVPTLSIYVDYKKAYDKVWHEGLIVKLYLMLSPAEYNKIAWQLENITAIVTGRPRQNLLNKLKKKLYEHEFASRFPPFQLYHYRQYLISYNTSEQILQHLIEAVKNSASFTLDTESVCIPYR